MKAILYVHVLVDTEAARKQAALLLTSIFFTIPLMHTPAGYLTAATGEACKAVAYVTAIRVQGLVCWADMF